MVIILTLIVVMILLIINIETEIQEIMLMQTLKSWPNLSDTFNHSGHI